MQEMKSPSTEQNGAAASEAEHKLLQLNLKFSLAHAGFLLIFLVLHVYEMVFYNIFSVLFFLFLHDGLRKHRFKNLNHVSFAVTAEFIVHQLLATFFTGFSLGFQYILFSFSFPLMPYEDSPHYLLHNRTRAAIGITLYVIEDVLLRLRFLVPVYAFKEEARFIVTLVIIVIVMYMMNSEVLESLVRLERSLRSYREKELNESIRSANLQKKIVQNVASIIEDRDSATGEHTSRTSRYVDQICRALAQKPSYADTLTEEVINRIVQTAPLHDIGKIKTPDAILNKPGKLTPEEFEIIKRHTTDGGEIIHRVFHDIDDQAYEDTAYEIAVYHHERWDGKGYPAGLKETEIPLAARIMAVADVYDALISKRVYKDAYDRITALEIIEEESGTHFDPEIAEVFLRLKREHTMM